MFNNNKLKKIGLSIASGLLLSALAVKPAAAQDSKIAYTEYTAIDNNPKTELFISDVNGLNQKMLYDSVMIAYPSGVYKSGRVSFSPDGQYIAVQNTLDQQVIMDTTGNILFRFSGGNRSQQDFIWGPDSSIYYSKYVDGIYKFSMKNATLEKILTTNGYTYDHNPAINPSNTHLAYIHHEYTSNITVNVMDQQTKVSTVVASKNGTTYDEPLDLNWIDDNHLLFKITDKDSIFYTDVNLKETKAYNVGQFTNIALSPDRKYVAITGGLNLGIFDTEQLGNDSLIINHTNIEYPKTVAWSKDSEYFIVNLNKYLSYVQDWNDSLNIFDKNLIKYKFANKDIMSYTECVDWSNIDPGSLEVATQGTTGVKEINNSMSKTKLYPNPVKDYANIELKLSKPTKLDIKIYDISGKIQYSNQENVSGEYKRRLDMTPYPSGVYIMKIGDENSLIKTEKIIKQ